MTHRNSANGEVATLTESDERSYLLALLGAMKDGIISEFDFQGFTVRRVGESVEVCDGKTKRPLGGYLLLESTTTEEVANWIEMKREYYGANR